MITVLLVPSSVGAVATETQMVVLRSVFSWRLNIVWVMGAPQDGVAALLAEEGEAEPIERFAGFRTGNQRELRHGRPGPRRW